MTTKAAENGEADQVCPRCSAPAGKPCRKYARGFLTDLELAPGRVHVERGSSPDSEAYAAGVLSRQEARRDVRGEHEKMRQGVRSAMRKLTTMRDHMGRFIAASSALGIDPTEAVTELIDAAVWDLYLPKTLEPKRRARGSGRPTRIEQRIKAREGGGQGRTTRRGDGRTRLAKEIAAESKETSSES